MLIYLVRKYVKNKKTANILTVILTIPAVTIGLSRIYLGVHFPTDVLAGWCLGIITIVVIISIKESLKN
jgi:undecaprenyl-diphosphatase